MYMREAIFWLNAHLIRIYFIWYLVNIETCLEYKHWIEASQLSIDWGQLNHHLSHFFVLSQLTSLTRIALGFSIEPLNKLDKIVQNFE